MAQTANNSGKKARLEIGKEIDWTKVTPSITRPVWEPPALEVLDAYEEVALEDEKHLIPDPATRSRHFELSGEFVNLQRYMQWTRQTQQAAEKNCDQGKVDWYEELYQTLAIDFRDVCAESKEFLEAAEGPIFQAMGSFFRQQIDIWDMMLVPESDQSAPRGSKPWLKKLYRLLKDLRGEAAAVPLMTDDLDEQLEDLKLKIGSDFDTSSNEASSPASYRTARDDTSSHSDEELGNLIDFDSSPPSDTEDAAGISAILESTGNRDAKTASLQENQAVALFTFEADQPGDLAFKKGDVITVRKRTENDFSWWTGTLNGETGIFPSNYVLMKSWEASSEVLNNGEMR